MNAIVSFQGGQLPAYLQNRSGAASINDEVATRSSHGSLSIKGKVFTLVKDDERKVLTNPQDPDEPLQSLELAVIRANPRARVFYMKSYSEDGDDASMLPTCYSNNGETPAADAQQPQARKCQLCPHSVWGSKRSADGEATKGTACTVNTRLAIIDPQQLGKGGEEPLLLRVPAGSRKAFNEVVKVAKSRNIPYNALAIKVSFDMTAPAPKLKFRPVGFLSDQAYAALDRLYDDESVLDICGLIERQPQAPAAPAPADEDDMEAAFDRLQSVPLGGRVASPAPAPAASHLVTEADLEDEPPAPPVKKTKAPAPKPAPVPAPAPVASHLVTEADLEDDPPAAAPAKKAKAAPAPAPAANPDDADMGSLMSDLDALLSATDD